MRIKAENLSYAYDERRKASSVKALDNVSLEINEGEFFGVIGKTGSGKSTFLQHINGLIKIKKGDGLLSVGEFDLSDKKCDFKKLRAAVGMVFQYPEYQLFAETVEEDVAFGLKNFDKNVSEEDKKGAVCAALTAVGLDYEKIKDKSPLELSGGQKRRVAIAGVLVTKPQTLILDEPVAGLDPAGRKEFIALLKELKKDYVKTIVMVSHDLDLICENCDRLAVFSEGKIVKAGTPKEVFLSGEGEVDQCLTSKLTRALEEEGTVIKSDLTMKDFADKFAEYYFGGNGGKPQEGGKA